MSSYIKQLDWSEFQTEDDEKLYSLYDEIEQNDKRTRRKHQTKLREYEGYNEE